MSNKQEAIDLLQNAVDVVDKPEADIMQQAIDILSESEPEPGEFRELAERVLWTGRHTDNSETQEFVKEACGIIGSQAAENTKLRGILKEISERAYTAHSKCHSGLQHSELYAIAGLAKQALKGGD